MKKMRLCAFLLLVVMLLASCSGTNDQSGAETTGDAETTAPGNETTAEPTVLDYLPTGNYNNQEVTILLRSHCTDEFSIAEQTGDRVDDAVYKRNRKIEENLGVKLNYVDVTGDYNNRSTYINAIANSVNADTGEFDLCASAANYLFTVVGQGYFYDLMPNSALNLSQPWWSQGFIENMKVADTLYLASGSAALDMIDNLCVTYFNKGMIEDFTLENPYDLVREGKWTFEKMIEMSATVLNDTTGDGEITKDDRIGLYVNGNMMNAQIQSFGLSYCTRDAEGYPQVVPLNEKIINAYELMSTAYHSKEMYGHKGSSDTIVQATEMAEIFNYGNMLFMQQILSQAEALRQMEEDFGILPMPKMSEDQDRYYAVALENLTVLGIPASAKDEELSGKVLESLAIIGHEEVIPAYFEIALKTMTSRDTESGEMLDLILESTWFDFFYLNSPSLDGINHLFRQQFNNGNAIVPAYEAKKPVLEAKLEILLEGYRALKEW